MILYHGSDHRIEHPTPGLGSPHNDYGLGFYCTASADLAKEWACPTKRGGYANRYRLQTFRVPYDSCDVMRGFRADDSYFSFAKAFLRNEISLQTLDTAMRLGDLGCQIVVKSRLAFRNLQYLGCERAAAEPYYRLRKERDARARAAYTKQRQKGSALTDTLLIDMMRGGWQNDDERLRQRQLG